MSTRVLTYFDTKIFFNIICSIFHSGNLLPQISIPQFEFSNVQYISIHWNFHHAIKISWLPRRPLWQDFLPWGHQFVMCLKIHKSATIASSCSNRFFCLVKNWNWNLPTSTFLVLQLLLVYFTYELTKVWQQIFCTFILFISHYSAVYRKEEGIILAPQGVVPQKFLHISTYPYPTVLLPCCSARGRGE